MAILYHNIVYSQVLQNPYFAVLCRGLLDIAHFGYIPWSEADKPYFRLTIRFYGTLCLGGPIWPLFIYTMENQKEINNRIYELAVLLVPTLEESHVPGVFTEVKGLFEDRGALFISEDMPKMLPLSYEMSRTIENKKTWFETAYFGWVKFDLDPEKLHEIKEILARDERVIRFLILKTVKENTLASKKSMYTRKREDKKTDGEASKEEAKPELSEEQIEAEIDALVTE